MRGSHLRAEETYHLLDEGKRGEPRRLGERDQGQRSTAGATGGKPTVPLLSLPCQQARHPIPARTGAAEEALARIAGMSAARCAGPCFRRLGLFRPDTEGQGQGQGQGFGTHRAALWGATRGGRK